MAEIVEHTATARPQREQLVALVGDILSEAEVQGATSAEAAVNFSSALSVTVRTGEVETLEHHRSRSLAVTVYIGTRKGSASTSDWGVQAMRDTVRAACDIARHTAADPCAGLADPDRLARSIPNLDLYHPWALEPEQAIAIAKTCEAAALDYDPRIKNSEGGSVSSSESLSMYGNSNGFMGGYPSTRHGLSCSVIAQDAGGMQRDYWYSAARAHPDLEAPESVGLEAARRAVRRLDAKRLSTRQAPVLFVPELARGLVSHFIGAVSGGALYRKSSFLLNSLGTQVFPAHFQIREEPHLTKALGSAPFDSEGVATEPRDLVRDGVVQGYVLDSYAARRLGMATTGNGGGIHNLLVASGARDFEELVRHMGTGLIVTQLMGQGVKLVTGDYSRGASGFWVENGAIQHPVEEITIAGNLREMFQGIAEVGRDVDARGVIRTGSILIERMTIAGS
ncbi:MAG: metalloprotease PmbA [Gammaproteobacteria bacterium]